MVRHHHLWCLFEHQHGFQWLTKPLTYLQGFQKLGKSKSSFWASWIGGNSSCGMFYNRVFGWKKICHRTSFQTDGWWIKRKFLPQHDPNISGSWGCLFSWNSPDSCFVCVDVWFVTRQVSFVQSEQGSLGSQKITKVSDVQESQRPGSADSTLWMSLAWCIYT